MSEPIDDAVRRAWHDQPPQKNRATPAVAIERHVREQRRRKRAFMVSAAIIVPAHLAAFWFMPDLRPVAAVGLIVGAILAWAVLRRGAAPRSAADMPCAAYEREVLTRERNFHRSMPRLMVPIVVGQIAIVATLWLNPRFNKHGLSAQALTGLRFEEHAVFTTSLSAFIVTVVAVLLVIARRSRRILKDVEKELVSLGKAIEV